MCTCVNVCMYMNGVCTCECVHVWMTVCIHVHMGEYVHMGGCSYELRERVCHGEGAVRLRVRQEYGKAK